MHKPHLLIFAGNHLHGLKTFQGEGDSKFSTNFILPYEKHDNP